MSAQQIDIQPYRLKSSDQALQHINEMFSAFQLVEVKTDFKKKSRTDQQIISIPFFGSRVDVNLEEVSLYSPHYTAQIVGQDGLTYLPKPNAKTYKEKDASVPSRLTVTADYVYGYFTHKGINYYIEPINQLASSLPQHVHIVYSADKVLKASEKWQCAADSHMERTEELVKDQKNNSCGMIEIAIALDYLYVNKHGGASAAIEKSTAIMNMVEGDYANAFNRGLRYQIVTHYVSNCGNCDPWSASVDPAVLLNSLTAWGPNGFGVQHDLGTIWTGRNLCSGGSCGVAGLAWIGSVCTNYKYSILEDFTSTVWALRVLTSHEIGHNFGAGHDSGAGNIMAGSISQNTSSWSQQSRNEINSRLPGYTCLADCLIGSCSEIANLSILSCLPGSPSTYAIEVEVAHGGGGGSSGFSIEVKGQSFSFGWQASPQKVTIIGLVATGEQQVYIRIRANDNSDSNCFGSMLYDEPNSNCSVTKTYDFNDCQLPANWTTASTNIYTWNGGDPRVQYEWRFGDANRLYYHYNQGANNATTRTLDGTCMVYFDDDVVNHSLYTGVITITTSTFDLSFYDEASVSFDYMFHRFNESPKGTNASYFSVEIWNGASWINILTDNTSKCVYSAAWTAPCLDAFTADITPYLNSALRFRFIYSDGNNSSWTGTVGIDNLIINASVDPSSGGSACDQVVTINQSVTSGQFQAAQLINTQGNVFLTSGTTLTSPEFIVTSEFTVSTGAELSILAQGCNN